MGFPLEQAQKVKGTFSASGMVPLDFFNHEKNNLNTYLNRYTKKRMQTLDVCIPSSVSKMRLELTQPNGHYPLKVARLPIPPPGHFFCGRISARVASLVFPSFAVQNYKLFLVYANLTLLFCNFVVPLPGEYKNQQSLL